jgi:hypothetical protein
MIQTSINVVLNERYKIKEDIFTMYRYRVFILIMNNLLNLLFVRGD